MSLMANKEIVDSTRIAFYILRYVVYFDVK